MKRNDIIQRYIENPEIPVLIVGGGVNGIGTFRDLALQGVDVLLVEKGDFCSGGSAASSHMVHGGIRYLEYGEFRLVREAVRERNLLLQNAPHYVKPLPTVIPIFKWFSGLFNAPLKFLSLLDKPSERGGIVIKIGLMFYDAFTGGQRTVPRHQFVGKQKTLTEFPAMHPDVKFTARYFDGAMHSPERICIDLLLDAEQAHAGAKALNYVELVSADGEHVVLKDGVTGQEFTVKPQIVINAAGAWIDFANQKLGKPSAFMGGTKGSHIIVDNPELREILGENEIFFENKDGRITLLYPLLDKVMIGTSDLPIDDPEDAVCTEEEIDYFIDLVPVIFPNVKIDRSQIIYQFSGVRPLPVSEANRPGQVSRDHSIKVVEAGKGLDFAVLSLVGGKWTSFRALSEEVTDEVLAFLGESRKASTENLAIGGGKDYPKTNDDRCMLISRISETADCGAGRAATLFERYGTQALKFAAHLASGDDPLSSLPTYSRQEIECIAAQEKVVRLSDFILRRTMLAKLNQLSVEAIRKIAEIIAPHAYWANNIEGEVSETIALLRNTFGMKL